MRFWIHQAGATSSRTFTLDEIQGQLNSGQLSPTDRICADGQTDWQRVEDVVSAAGPPPPPPPGGDYGAMPMPMPPGARTGRGKTVALAAVALVAVCVLGALVYFLFGGGRSLPGTAKYVPDDSLMVMTFYPGDLFQKADVDDILDKGMLGSIIDDRKIEKQLTRLLKEPDKLGVDLGEPIYFFIRPSDAKDDEDPVFGLTIPVLSKEAFLSGIGEITSMMDGREKDDFDEFRNELRSNGFFHPEDEIYFAINDDVLLILGQDRGWRDEDGANLARMSEAILKGESGLAEKDDTFLAHQKDSFRFDIGIWGNLLAALKMAEDLDESIGDVAALGNQLTVAGGIRFEAGEIAGKLTLNYDEDQLGDWSGDGIPSELLDAVPDGSLFAMSQSMNMAVIKKYLNASIRKDTMAELSENLEDEFDMSLDEILDAFQGDIILAMDMEWKKREWGGRRPEPVFIVGATIKDPSTVRRLFRNAEEDMNDEGIQLVIKDNVMFICSEDHANALEDGKVSNPVSGEKRAALGDHDFGMTGDFRKLARELSKDARPGSEEDLAADYLSAVKLFTLTGDSEAGSQSYVARLLLENDDDNSLKQIVDKTIGFAIKEKKRYEERRREWEPVEKKPEANDNWDVPDPMNKKDDAGPDFPNEAKEKGF